MHRSLFRDPLPQPQHLENVKREAWFKLKNFMLTTYPYRDKFLSPSTYKCWGEALRDNPNIKLLRRRLVTSSPGPSLRCKWRVGDDPGNEV